MRTIPAALIWELFTRGRWLLPLGILGANLMPIMLYGLMAREGEIEAGDSANIVMSMVLIQINLLTFASMVLTSQGVVSRLYALPIRTSALVAWHMIPAMFLVFFQAIFSTLLLNAMFDVNWPLWGPALTGAVAIAMVQAAMWSTDKTAWLPISVSAVSAVIGLWYKSRFGPVFSQVTHMWVTVTPWDVITLIALAIAAYYVAVLGVARNRCGEPIAALGIVAWLQWFFDPPPELGPPFKSAVAAQRWFEWRKKAFAFPGSTVFCIVLALGGWSITSRDPKDLVEMFVVGGGLLSGLAAVGGLVMGNTGASDNVYDITSFLGTRPMTTLKLSQTILRVSAESVLYAWSAWAVAFLVVAAILFATGYAPTPFLPAISWWYFPATLLGCWTVVSVGATIGLWGHGHIVAAVISVIVCVTVALLLASKLLLTEETRRQLNYGLLFAMSGAFIIATAAFLSLAWRRKLLSAAGVSAAVAVWLLLSGVVVWEATRHTDVPRAVYCFVAGLAALAVLPFAGAPLALTSNRHR